MQVADSVQQRLLERAVAQFLQVRDQVLLSAVQESGWRSADSARSRATPPGPLPGVLAQHPARWGLPHGTHGTRQWATHLWRWMSAAHVVRMSMAVRRVCLREGTKTMTGFLGECLVMAWYTGLAMDSRRVCVWLMLKP